MRILTKNTVFKTAVLTGLLSCLLALAGAFFGTTVSVHAMHEGFIHAEDVHTEADLEQFVEDAVNAYYIDFIIKSCDFKKITTPAGAIVYDLISAQFGGDFQNFLHTPAADLRPSVPLFHSIGLTKAEMEKGCDFSHRFDQVFDKGGNRGEGDWKSGPIYLFVINDEGRTLFHGADPNLEGKVLAAVDEGKNDVNKLIIGEVENPRNGGIVEYCWDNPDVPGDEILENGKPIEGKAPGDSWKKSYVVDPFVSLRAPELSSSPGVIFGSGIYPDPETGTAPPGCDGNGMADYDGNGMADYDGDGMDGDGMDAASGGCAIVAGSDSTPRGTAFNLLLIVSVLFLAVSFGSRAMDKRNGVRS